MMQIPLVPHPSSIEPAVTSLRVALRRERTGWLRLEYVLHGNLASLRVAPPAPAAGFADRLWEHTCFELFLRRPGESAYFELNFATSGEWAAYAFTSYRTGMRLLPAVNPQLEVHRSRELRVLVAFPLAALHEKLAAAAFTAAPSAVIENANGRRSFWAAHHAMPQPDFHHADAFIVRLEPAEH